MVLRPSATPRAPLPLMAPLRPADGHWECLFIGVDQKSSPIDQSVVFDPERTVCIGLWLACFDLILVDFSPVKARRSCDA
jgi:hypothetical protein